MRSLGLCSPVSEEKNVLFCPHLSRAAALGSCSQGRAGGAAGPRWGLEQTRAPWASCWEWELCCKGSALSWASLPCVSLGTGSCSHWAPCWPVRGTGMSTKGIAQNSWSSSCPVPAQSLVSNLQPCPAPPEQGLKGWNLARFCLFCPKCSSLAWAKLGWAVSKFHLAAESTAGLWCLVPLIKNVLPQWPNVKSEKFWGEEIVKAALQNGCFPWKNRSLWVFIALKNSSCFGQKATETEPWACGVHLPQRSKSKKAEGAVQGCSWEENSSGQCFGSGTVPHVTELSH